MKKMKKKLKSKKKYLTAKKKNIQENKRKTNSACLEKSVGFFKTEKN